MTDTHEPRLRALMEKLAREAPEADEPPRRLIVRAQRRVALTVFLAAAVVVFGVTSGIYLASRWASSEEKPITPDRGARAILDVSSQRRVGTLDVDVGLGLACYEVEGVRGATSAEIRTQSGSVLELFTSNGNPYAAVGCKHNIEKARLRSIIEHPDDHVLRFHNSESGGTLEATLRVTDREVAGPARIGWIAFLRASKSWGQHIYLMGPDGSEPTRLPVDQFYGSTLTWSPDGAAIAFDRGIAEGRHDVVRVNADGTGKTVILTDRGRRQVITAQGLDWSPDGSRLAFSNGSGDLYSMNVDGTGLRRLTRSGPPCGDLDPSWSPDGTRTVFARDCADREGESTHIQVIDLATGARTDLTEGPLDTQPAWSPDGTRIAFTRDQEIFVMGADGADPRRVSRMSEVFGLDWSPDGRALVFATGRGRVAYVDVESGEVTRLTPGPGDQSPVWGP